VTTSDQPGMPMRPGSAGTASAGYRVPVPRRPLPQETDPAQTGRTEER
jgi:hypothetical protein